MVSPTFASLQNYQEIIQGKQARKEPLISYAELCCFFMHYCCTSLLRILISLDDNIDPMSLELRLKRLQNQYEDALQALQDQDDQKIEPSIRAIILPQPNNLLDYGEWMIIFQGKEYSNLQGGNYKLRVRIGEKYPYEPPEVYCMDGFQHFHVFAGGKVCYKLLNRQNWKIQYTILILVNGIIKMLHSDPEISDPASTTLVKLVEKGESRYHQPNLKEYCKFLKSQAKRFGNRYQSQISAFLKANNLPSPHSFQPNT